MQILFSEEMAVIATYHGKAIIRRITLPRTNDDNQRSNDKEIMTTRQSNDKVMMAIRVSTGEGSMTIRRKDFSRSSPMK